MMKNQSNKLMDMISKVLSVENNKLEFCKVAKRSEKGLGFVIHDTRNRYPHYYLHTGKGDAGLTIGDGLICLIVPSLLCRDRLDVKEYIPANDTKDLVGVMIEKLDPPRLLQMFQYHWVKQQIVSHFYDKLFDRILKNEIAMAQVLEVLGGTALLETC